MTTPEQSSSIAMVEVKKVPQGEITDYSLVTQQTADL